MAAVALTAGLTTGCDAVNKALDCVQTADAVATSVTNLQQAVENAVNDPTQADEALASIDKNLNKIGDKTDNADVNKAVDDLNKAVDNVRTAIKNGDRPRTSAGHGRGGRTDEGLHPVAESCPARPGRYWTP